MDSVSADSIPDAAQMVHERGSIIGYRIAIVPQDEPVEKETNPANMNVARGNAYGEKLPEMEFVKKSAVCRSSVIDDKAQAKIKIIIAVSIVLKPLIILPTVSWILSILCDKVSIAATESPEILDQSRAR